MSRFTGTSEQHRLRDLLRQIRVEAGLKQAELAEKLKQSQSFVSKYESGERRLDLLELRDICAAVGLSLAEFVQRLERLLLNETRPEILKPTKAFLGKRPKH
jgi:transcriptional regulator with XRE-family HTH domain